MLGLFKKKEKKLNAFARGTLVPLENVNDPVFSEKMMGDGFAIQLTDNAIYAPIDATISMIAETKHAIGFTDKDGIEFIIHVGLETVNLKGQGFHALVKVGDQVTQGTKLLEVDTKFMKTQGIDLITPCVITNYQIHPFTFVNTTNTVEPKDCILTFSK